MHRVKAPRATSIFIRVSAPEKALLVQAATAAESTLSDLIRTAALDWASKVAEESGK